MLATDHGTRLSRIGSALGTITLLCALAAFSFHGWYARYRTDDFCTAAAVRHKGLILSGLDVRNSWSGRFSFFFIKGLFELCGSWTPRVLPALLIGSLLGCTWWTLRRVLHLDRFRMLCAAAIVFATFDATPDVLGFGGPLVWETGAITYTLPLIAFMLWLSLFREGSGIALRSFASGLLLFVAGGLSETSLAAQGAMAAGALAVALGRRDRRRSWIAGAGLMGTLLALVVVASAPGNWERMSTAPARDPLLVSVVDSFSIALSFAGSHTLLHGQAVLVVLVAASLAGTTHTRLRPSLLLLAAAVAAAAYACSFLPSRWMLSNAPPDRALIVPNFFLVLIVASLAAAYNRWRASREDRPITLDAAALILVCVVVPLVSMAGSARQLPRARLDAAQADRITEMLRSARGSSVVVRSPWALDMDYAGGPPTFWVNRCMADYFGAKSLTITR